MSAFPQTVGDWGLYKTDLSPAVAAELSRQLRQAEKDLVQHLYENCVPSGGIKDVAAFKEAVYKCFERHLISSMKRHTDVGAADTAPQKAALDYLFYVAAQHCDPSLSALHVSEPIEA